MTKTGKSIVILCKYANAPEDRLGTSRVFSYAKNFSEMGYQVKLISSRSNGSASIPPQHKLAQSTYYDDLEFIRINGPLISLGFSIKRIWSWLVYEWNLRRYLKQKKVVADVVLVSSLSLLTIFNGLYLKRKHQARFVLEIRDIWPFSLVELSSLSYKNPLVKFLAYIEKKGYQNADFIVGSMPNLKAHVQQMIGANNKVGHIPMAFDEKLYLQSTVLEEELIRRIPKDKFIMGYAGTIGNANALEIMFQAFIEIHQPNAALVVLGDGPLIAHYREKYESEQIIFLGKTAKNKVQDFLSRCDLLLNSWHDLNIYKYGVSPNKWIDYMYAAKPVLVSYSGYQSIINEAKCGEFVPAEDTFAFAQSMLKFMRMPAEERQKMGENGRTFLLDRMNDRTLSKEYLKILFPDEKSL